MEQEHDEDGRLSSQRQVALPEKGYLVDAGRLSLEWDDMAGLLPEVGTDPGSDEESPDSTCPTSAP